MELHQGSNSRNPARQTITSNFPREILKLCLEFVGRDSYRLVAGTCKLFRECYMEMVNSLPRRTFQELYNQYTIIHSPQQVIYAPQISPWRQRYYHDTSPQFRTSITSVLISPSVMQLYLNDVGLLLPNAPQHLLLEWNYKILARVAVKEGRVDVMDHICRALNRYHILCDEEFRCEIVKIASKFGHVCILQWLYASCKCKEPLQFCEVIAIESNALLYNQKHVLKWMESNNLKTHITVYL